MGKNATETFKMLEVPLEYGIGKTQILSGFTSPKSGRPSISKTYENVDLNLSPT
jgi:hypothetical protein